MFERRAPGAPLLAHAVSWPTLLCLVTAIIGLRCHEFFLNPDLRAEDGKSVFAYFYTHRELATLLRFKAGYVPLLPNILGFISVRLPARVTPYFLTIAPALLTLCAFCVFRASAYRRFVASDAVRFGVCLALAIAPIGTFFMVCHTDYSIWNALLLTLWLAILPMPRQKLSAIALSLALAVLIWTHPLTVLALPATLLWLLRDKSIFSRLLYAGLTLCQLAHIGLGTEPHRAAFVKGQGLLQRLGELCAGVFDHVSRAVLSTLCPWGSSSLVFDYAVLGGFVFAFLACTLLPKRRVASRTFYAWVAYCIVVPMALIVFARADHGLGATRYHYVSKAFTAVAGCLICWQGLFSITRRWSLRPASLQLVPALGSLLYFVSLNSDGRGLDSYRQTAPDNAELVREFFQSLAALEREQGGYCNIRLRCNKKQGDWPIAISTKGLCDN